MLRNWLKIAFIFYKKNGLFTVINLLGLTLGLTGFILMALYYLDENSYEKWNPNAENIYLAEHYWEKDNEYLSSAPIPEGYAAVEKIPEVESKLNMESWMFETVVETNGKKHFIGDILGTEQGFFDYFPFKVASGNPEKALEDINRIALSKEYATLLFGDKNPVGKTLKMHKNEFVVEGVYTLPENTAFKAKAIVKSDAFDKRKSDDNWGNYSYYLFFKLKKEANEESVQKKIGNLLYEKNNVKWAKEDGVSQEEYDKKQGLTKVFLTPLNDLKLHAVSEGVFGTKSNYTFLLIGLILSLIILLLSSINCVNLTIANAGKRAKETGIRKTIGAGKIHVFFQILLEIALLGFMSFFFSLVLIELLLPSFNSYFKKELVLTNNLNVIWLGIITTLLIIIISGGLPALYIANYKPVKVLKGNFSRSKSGIWLRNGILTLQFIISAFFIIMAIVIQSQLNYMINKDLGFKGDQIMAIYYKSRQDGTDERKLYKKAAEILSTLPEVVAYSSSNSLPNGRNTVSSNIDYENSRVQTNITAMDYNYLDLMQIQIKEGRSLSSKFASDTISGCLVNETFVKEMGWKDGLGKKISWGGDSIKYEIIGIVKDFNSFGFENRIDPTFFVHYSATDWMWKNLNNILVKIDSKNIPATVEKIEKVWKTEIEPGYPFDYKFIDQQFAETFTKYKKQRNLFFVLMSVVVLIAILGLFAMASYVMQQRLREIAIRKTLGAEDIGLIKLLSKNYLLIVSLATIIAIPVTYYFIRKWLDQFAYRIGMPYWAFLVGFIILILLTLLVVYFRAKQTTKVDLVKYLKYE